MASAQTTGRLLQDGASLNAPEGQSIGDPARALFDTFALCIVKRHYLQVKKVLAPPADLARDNKALPDLMDPACISGGGGPELRSYGGMNISLTTNPIAFRGVLYKALVRKDFARMSLVPAAIPAAMGGYNDWALQFVDCVVRGDGGHSLDLLRAMPGSEAEQSAIAALKPQLGSCMQQGASLRFSKGNLVGFLAEAYYREANASKSVGKH